MITMMIVMMMMMMMMMMITMMMMISDTVSSVPTTPTLHHYANLTPAREMAARGNIITCSMCYSLYYNLFEVRNVTLDSCL